MRGAKIDAELKAIQALLGAIEAPDARQEISAAFIYVSYGRARNAREELASALRKAPGDQTIRRASALLERYLADHPPWWARLRNLFRRTGK